MLQLLDMPDALLALILSHLPGESLAAVVASCQACRQLLPHVADVAVGHLGIPLPAAQKSCEPIARRIEYARRMSARSRCSLAAGRSFSLCISSSGHLFSWGVDVDDDYGVPDDPDELGSPGGAVEQLHRCFVGHLGHGSLWGQAERLPRALVALPQVVEVASGRFHCLLLASDGRLYSWGTGSFGQLGHGDRRPQPRPRHVQGFDGHAVQVACGHDHSLVVSSDGEVFSFGRGNLGQLGQGQMGMRAVPARVCLPPPPSQSVSTQSSSTVSAERVVHVAGGLFHSLAVTDAGDLFSWGSGTNGRLGHGDTIMQLRPRRVAALQSPRIVHASAGCGHSLAVSDKGELFSWGQGHNGRLGHGNQETKMSPALVQGLLGHVIVRAFAGWEHSVALTREGVLYAFGAGDHGALAQAWEEPATPARVCALGDDGACDVAAGAEHTLRRAARVRTKR